MALRQGAFPCFLRADSDGKDFPRDIPSCADAQERKEEIWPTEHTDGTDDTKEMRRMRSVKVCFMARAFSAFRGPLCAINPAIEYLR